MLTGSELAQRPTWKPPGTDEQFRGTRSYDWNLPRITENLLRLRRTASVPGTVMAITLKPEDMGGEAGDLTTPEERTLGGQGRTHNSRSCRYWDGFDHTPYREAAKMSCAIHSPSFKTHPMGFPFKGELELNPASIYTRKFQQGGEAAFRVRVPMPKTADLQGRQVPSVDVTQRI